MAEPLVRLAPVAYGYGPVGKALHIARALRSVFGDRIRLELVANGHLAATVEPGLCDRVGPLDEWARPAALTISVMNRPAAAAAADRGERVVFVDSLAWLWDKPMQLSKGCDRYLYQDLPFLPVPAANLVGQPCARPIGAITGLPVPCARAEVAGEEVAVTGTTGEPANVVVSLAGLENSEVDVARGNIWYARVLLGALRGLAEIDAELAQRITVFGNPAALKWAGGVVTPLRRGSGLQRHFLAAASEGVVVAIPPGLTSFIEMLHLRVPIRLLPPQNYSQIRIARALRAAGADIEGLTWDSELLDWLASQRVPERVGSQAVRNTICEQMLSGAIRPDQLADLLRTPEPALSPGDVASLIGPTTGAADVADAVVGLMQ